MKPYLYLLASYVRHNDFTFHSENDLTSGKKKKKGKKEVSRLVGIFFVCKQRET